MRAVAPPVAALMGAALVGTALVCAALTACAISVGGSRTTPPPTTAATAVDAEATTQIAAMMARSAEAWNRGDLDTFVEDYVPGEPPSAAAATYIGSRGIVRGRAAIRAAYAPRFQPGVRRGTLRFENLEVDVLGAGVANAIAYYVLSERTAAGADSTVARGPTSLVMRRGVDGRWRIAHDHSS